MSWICLEPKLDEMLSMARQDNGKVSVLYYSTFDLFPNSDKMDVGFGFLINVKLFPFFWASQKWNKPRFWRWYQVYGDSNRIVGCFLETQMDAVFSFK